MSRRELEEWLRYKPPTETSTSIEWTRTEQDRPMEPGDVVAVGLIHVHPTPAQMERLGLPMNATQEYIDRVVGERLLKSVEDGEIIVTEGESDS